MDNSAATQASREADRLTDEDRGRITFAINRAVAGWKQAGYTGTWADLSGLERIGVHAIGAGLSDLRAVESEWVRVAATKALGLPLEFEDCDPSDFPPSSHDPERFNDEGCTPGGWAKSPT